MVMGSAEPVKLVAHRGGIVDERHPENSFAALSAAIERGYWMAEIDVRRTSDGVFIIWHDAEMELNGTPVKIADTAWGSIRSNTTHELDLDATAGDSDPGSDYDRRPPTLEEVLERFAGEIRFMVDVKNRNHPPEVYPELEHLLGTYDQIEPAYFIGAPDGKSYFHGDAWTAGMFRSLESDEWEQAADTRQFLFGRGAELTADIVAHARDFGVPVIASVNLGHYAGLTEFPDPDLTAPREDIARLLRGGVRRFQIDSVFEPFVDERP